MTRPDVVENEVGPEQYDEHWSCRGSYIQEHPYEQPAIEMIKRSCSKPINVLEIGAGFGFTLIKILQEFKPETYVAYEFSSSVYHIRGLLHNLKSNSEVFILKKSFRDMFAPELYDCVIALEIFEHIIWDLEFIERLAPGTRVFFSVPTKPGKFHVRHFENEKEITDRYEDLLDFKEMIFVPNKWWVVNSIRKDKNGKP